MRTAILAMRQMTIEKFSQKNFYLPRFSSARCVISGCKRGGAEKNKKFCERPRFLQQTDVIYQQMDEDPPIIYPLGG